MVAHIAAGPRLFSTGSMVVLPDRVDLSCSAESVALLFPCGEGETRKLQMSMLELRQWLAIVHRQFQHAGWPMKVWPEWFTQTYPGPGKILELSGCCFNLKLNFFYN